MPRTFVDTNGNYFETVTDVPAGGDRIAVPPRPDSLKQWNGSAWVPDIAKENAERDKAVAARQLNIDRLVDEATTMAVMLGITVTVGELQQRASTLIPTLSKGK